MVTLVFVALWIVGLVGTFVPVVPATFVIFAGALLAGYLEGFSALSWPWLVGLGLVAVAASLVDNLAGGWGARKFGGSKAAMWGAILGGLAGLFIPFGLLVGPFAGALLAEVVFVRRALPDAVRSAFGTLVGLLTGIAAKFVLHVLMGLLVLWRLGVAS
nr:DUF456 family protein [Deinococcus pimensis]